MRYDGDVSEDPNTADIELSNSPDAATGYLGVLDTLLQWNLDDPPSDAERTRNMKVCSDYQGNRNPFVDHPEFAAQIDWAT